MKLSPKLPVTYMSSPNLALFLKIILFENPNEITVKLNFVENTVSPPQRD